MRALITKDEAALCDALGKLSALDRRAVQDQRAADAWTRVIPSRRYLQLYASRAAHHPDVFRGAADVIA